MQGFKVERTLGNLGFVTAILALNTCFNFKSGRLFIQKSVEKRVPIIDTASLNFYLSPPSILVHLQV